MAGMTCLTSICVNRNSWIIDSGATEHITPHVDLLHEIVKIPIPHTVVLPDGKEVLVTHSVKCIIPNKVTLLDVLLVPEIKFNLINVSKLIADSGNAVIFTNKGCYIEDPIRQNSHPLGNLSEKLFQLNGHHGTLATVRSNEDLVSIWHKRLGHVPFAKRKSSSPRRQLTCL